MNEKVALVSMIDDFFVPGFIAFYNSVKKNSPNVLKYPWLFIDVGTNKINKDRINKLKQDIHFIEPKVDKYKNVDMSVTANCLKNTYYKLDIFSFTEYDRVVFLDMDMIVLDNIDFLFHYNKHKIAGVPGYSPSKDGLRGSINTGLIIVNKAYLDTRLYNDIIHFGRFGASMPDQKIINKYFKGKIGFLPKEYNMEKRVYKGKKFNWKKAKILHFVSMKPWDKTPKDKNNSGFEELENLWKKYYEQD